MIYDTYNKHILETENNDRKWRSHMSFVEEMKKRVPVVAIRRSLKGEFEIKKELGISNKYDSRYDWENNLTPYLKQVQTYIDTYMSERPYDDENNGNDGNTEDVSSSMIFIVTDSTDIARKTAAYASYRFSMSESDDDDYDIYFDDDDDSKTEDSECTLVDFDNIIVPESLSDVKYVVSIGKIKDSEYTFFKGLKGEQDISVKTEAIQAAKCKVKFIHVTKEQLSKPWVLKMCIDNNATVWVVDNMKDSYYVDFVNEIMEAAGYEWEKGMSSEVFVRAVRKKTADEISEENISWFLEKASKRTDKVLKKTDFKELELDSTSATSRLKKMTGLTDMKNAIAEYVALEKEAVVNDKLKSTHSNMIFYGNPGTGKTTGAMMLGKILSENGVSSAKFNICTRKDIIGRYVGHTAPMVAKRFEESRGGILFVDEAGFFINNRQGDYTDEAMKEFIRYMETYPDVIVVFAMYENEVADFMNLDDGLQSRISRIVHFKDYTLDELWCIARDMFTDKGYVLDSACNALFKEYVSKLMKNKNFGNARDVRKIVESCIISLSIKHASSRSKKEKSSRNITEEIMKDAIERIDVQEKNNNSLFGFSSGMSMLQA